MIVRIIHTIRNIVPINTWAPWNPVATKNVDPYTLSAIENGASIYSPAWRNVKYAPNLTVMVSAWMAFVRFPSINLWCAQVTVTPEAKSTAVFSRGIENGFNGLIPTGGQQQPNSGVGESLLWKNAQKNAKKKHTSETMNNNIPYRNPFITYEVWCPKKVPSRITSRHHWIIDKIISVTPINIHEYPWPWNHLVRPVVNKKAPAAEVSGQGLGSTKWNGCRGIDLFKSTFFKFLNFLLGR